MKVENTIKATKNRNPALDIAKGIGIILIIFTHLTYNEQFQRNFVQLFDLPVFFIISGLFFREKKLTEVIKTNFFRYIIPAYSLLLFDILKDILQNGMFIFNDIEYFIKTITMCGGAFNNYPLWFLPTLYFITIIFNMLKNEKKRYIISGICLILSVFIRIEFNGYLWPLSIMFGMPFYCIGYIFNKYKILDKFNLLVDFKRKIIILVLGIMLIFGTFLSGYNSMIEQIFEGGFLIHFIFGILGFIFVYLIATIIKQSTFLHLFGQNTLFILLTHYYICRAIFPKIFKTFNLSNYISNIFIEIILLFIVCGMYYFAIRIINNIKYKVCGIKNY